MCDVFVSFFAFGVLISKKKSLKVETIERQNFLEIEKWNSFSWF